MSGKEQALTQVIQQIHTPSFSSALASWLRQQLAFDCVVILGFNQSMRPVYLYDDLSEQRALLFTQYLTGSYQQDPFYCSLEKGLSGGVYTLAELAAKEAYPHEYLTQFYAQTGWQHELDVVVEIAPTRKLVLFIGMTSHVDEFSARKQLNVVRSLYPTLAALCQKHWQHDPMLLAEPSGAGAELKRHMLAAMQSFLEDRLTNREAEIARYILQGVETRQIATLTGITEGTVKNHRKHIYAKLNIDSQSGLFNLFLNHVVCSPLLVACEEDKKA